MKKSYKTKLKIKSNKTLEFLKRSAGTYRKVYNYCTEVQLKVALEVGPKNYHLSGTKLLSCMSKAKSSFPYIKELDQGVFYAAIFSSTNAFRHKFDFHLDSIPFLSRKKTQPKFKTKGNVRVTQDSIIVPKLGKISLWERGRIPLGKKYSNVTFSFDGNDWFVSLEVEEEPPKVELTDAVVSLDFTNSGDFVLNGELIESPTKSKKYTSEEIKLKKALKKLKRQTKTNCKQTLRGSIPVTTRNMKKTRKLVDKKRNKLYNMRKDCFFKVVNEVARTKPKELHILSNSSIRATRNGYVSRAQRRGGPADFLRMMSKRLGIMGTRVLRHASIEEFPLLSPRL